MTTASWWVSSSTGKRPATRRSTTTTIRRPRKPSSVRSPTSQAPPRSWPRRRPRATRSRATRKRSAFREIPNPKDQIPNPNAGFGIFLMRKLLLQLDTSPHPSVFDRIVGYDGGADVVMSYGGVTPETVRDLVHGAIFTRGPKDLRNTAIFIGGTDMAAGERLLKAVRKSFFGPFTVP